MNITPYHSESKKSKYSEYYVDASISNANTLQVTPEDSNNNNNNSCDLIYDSVVENDVSQINYDMSACNDSSSELQNMWNPATMATATESSRSMMINENHRLPCPYDQQNQYHSTAMPISHTQNIMNMLHSNHLRRYEYEDFKTACKILNGREARNRAEKNRRDKLNGSIQELSTMVPHVAESPRRVDKTAVLRFSAHGLRINYVFGTDNGKNRLSIKPQTCESLVKLIEGFLLTVTCRGQILLVSPSVEQYLGHCQADLFGQNILNITHPDDHALLKQQLIPTDLVKLFELSSNNADNNNGNSSEHSLQRTRKEDDDIDVKLNTDKRDFTIRLARAGPRSEPTTYELVRIDGCFRRADQSPKGSKFNACTSGLQVLRRTRCRDDGIPLHSISGNDIVLIGMAKIIKQPNICDRLLEACKFEYKTRHLIDGRIVQCDQRISIVAGYLTEEVSGLSPFTFMHKDDVRWVMVALRQMYDNSAIGESCYRLMTRTGQFVYLKTRGYLEVDNASNKAHSFVCINSLVTEDEGKKLVREMKKNFSVLVNSSSDLSIESEVPTVENPHEIERAILNLITNLHPADGETDGCPSVESILDAADSKPDVSKTEVLDASSRTTKSPPLQIIAPNPNTIKSAISKSMAIVETNKDSVIVASQIVELSHSLESNSMQRPSVLQRTVTFSTSSHRGDQEERNNRLHQSKSFGNEFSGEIKTEPPNSPMTPIKQESHLMSPLSISTNAMYHCEEIYATDGHHHPLMNYNYHTNLYPPSCNPTMTSPPFYSPSTHYLEDDSSNNSSCLRLPNNSVLKRGHDDYMMPESVKKRHTSTHHRTDGDSMLPFPDLNDTTSADLMHTLPKTFQALDRSLAHIEGATCNLKEQCNNYALPSAASHKQKINEIMEEHQQQKEILQSIQEEFETQLTSDSTTCATTSSGYIGNPFGDKQKLLVNNMDKTNVDLVNQFDESGKTRPS